MSTFQVQRTGLQRGKTRQTLHCILHAALPCSSVVADHFDESGHQTYAYATGKAKYIIPALIALLFNFGSTRLDRE